MKASPLAQKILRVNPEAGPAVPHPLLTILTPQAAPFAARVSPRGPHIWGVAGPASGSIHREGRQGR